MRLGGVFKPLGPLLKAIWPETEKVEKPLVFLAFWSLGRSGRRLGGVLEASWSVSNASWIILEPCWRRLGVSWMCLDASRSLVEPCGGLKCLGASWSRLGRVLKRLETSKNTHFWTPKTVKPQHVHNLHRNANYTIIPLIFCFISSSRNIHSLFKSLNL